MGRSFVAFGLWGAASCFWSLGRSKLLLVFGAQQAAFGCTMCFTQQAAFGCTMGFTQQAACVFSSQQAACVFSSQ
ncbi:MAG TPA: hypothetical protein ENK85_05660 [Saprospiraceae bacterium]|nr:hypothetical protein [Saprospiraceae bacterium]